MKFLALLCLAALPAVAATSCADLAKVAIANATITEAAAVESGSFTPMGGQAMSDLPAFCRVALTLKPSSDSDIKLEVWMPASGWNGKFEGVGNGGFAGAISFPALAQAIKQGYATASTDTGHRAGGTDAGWALNHPEKIADFGYRAIHESAVAAKALMAAFYGNGPKRSYFNSCSNGGRQALMEAQRFPADYDGIIAGAPANPWTRLLSLAIVNSQSTLSDMANYIPANKLASISAAALAACDANDGVKDGVIENPGQCKFDPDVLLCKGEDGTSCLTGPQVKALKSLYAGARTSKGEQIMPGYSPGGEAEPGGWAAWITGMQPQGSAMFAFGTQFYKNMVFSDASWDFKTFNLDRDYPIADSKVGKFLSATDPDLSAFKKRGGKLIIFHGWSDAAIPPQNAIDYYSSVQKKMGAKDTSDFVRLFMVPGMQHCGGGSGPSSFGANQAPTGDAQHDMGAALEQWVNGGAAPEQIIATKYKGGGMASGVSRTRPLCAYPKTAVYKGSGDTDDAANFVCK